MSSARRHAQSGAATGLACRIHDVDDVFAYVQSVVARRGAELEPADREELMAYLLVETVSMSGVRNGRYAYAAGEAPKGVYDPARAVSFSTWLGWQLPRRVIDWKRKTMGDSRYQKTQRVVFSLEQRIGSGAAADSPRTLADRIAHPHDLVEQVHARERLRAALDEAAA